MMLFDSLSGLGNYFGDNQVTENCYKKQEANSDDFPFLCLEDGSGYFPGS